MRKVKLPIQLVGAEAVPRYAHIDDAGFDLAIMDSIQLRPGEKKLVSCGLKMAIPARVGPFNLFGLVVPRSSSSKLHYSLANTVGVIDSPYRGEIMLYIKNNSLFDTVNLVKNQMVAQMVLVPYVKADFVVQDFLSESERGEKGWGSTGTGTKA